jgi:predicted O-methyltransferase YrrM
MKDEFYIMRTTEQREGLQNMIDWLNTIRPTSEMRMIEIGSYVGESTLMFANHFKEVISVDPYVNDYDLNDMARHTHHLIKYISSF